MLADTSFSTEGLEDIIEELLWMTEYKERDEDQSEKVRTLESERNNEKEIKEAIPASVHD